MTHQLYVHRLAVSMLPQHQSRWDNYVQSHPEGTVFHLMAWQRLIESSFSHEPYHLIAEDSRNGDLLGVLPLFLVGSRIFGTMLISTPQAAYGGALATSPAACAALLGHAVQLAQAKNVQFLELRNFQNGSTHPSMITKDLYVTFRQQLWGSPERNFLAIPRKTRAAIREGLRNGLRFRVNVIGADEFFDIYSRSVHDLGTPVFPKTLFANGLREFGSMCKLFSVHWNDKLVSAVWTLFFRDEVVPYYGGSIRKYRHLAVNSFMYWMLMRYGCENGYRIFDFG